MIEKTFIIIAFSFLAGVLVFVAVIEFNLADGSLDLPGRQFVLVDAEQEVVEEFGCLTSLDLNRDDLRDVVILSNPCFQFGLPLNLYLQQDEQGNQFGIPVCSLEVDS